MPWTQKIPEVREPGNAHVPSSHSTHANDRKRHARCYFLAINAERGTKSVGNERLLFLMRKSLSVFDVQKGVSVILVPTDNVHSTVIVARSEVILWCKKKQTQRII